MSDGARSRVVTFGHVCPGNTRWRDVFHGQTAAALVKAARGFACDIEVSVEGEAGDWGRPPHEDSVDAKSMSQVLRLYGTRPGMEFTIVADGEGADDALDALEREIRWRIRG